MAYINRAAAYGQKGEYNQSILDCTKAIEIDPGFAMAYGNRAVSYYSIQDYDRAWEDIRKAESLGLQIPPALLNDICKKAGR